jgi:hypothetical protein
MACNVRIDGKENLRSIKGEDVHWRLQFYHDDTMAPMDLSGTTVTMRTQAADGTALEVACVATDNKLGQMTVDVTAAQTATMTAKTTPPHGLEFKLVKESRTNYIKKPGIWTLEAPLFG